MKRILIIDDDPVLLDVLQVFFQQHGFEVIKYQDKNSVKGVIINRPDIVLLDNRLNDGWGHELCSEIKANELTRHIPVILISGHADLEALASKCGADACLNKPFDLEKLLDAVNDNVKIR